jgi:hypothetical protein
MNKKNHYFIGHMIRFEPSLIKSFDKSKRFIENLKDVRVKDATNNYHTRFIYLGYLDDKTANELIDNKLDIILQTVVNKIDSKTYNTTCNIEGGINIYGHKSTYKKVAIYYKNDLIEKKIVPLLRKITEDLYGKYKYKYNPHINLMSVYPLTATKLDVVKSKLYSSDIELPKTFTIDSIDILKSSTVELRKGRSSKNDESNVETIYTYKFNKASKNIKTEKKKKKSIMSTISNLFSN